MLIQQEAITKLKFYQNDEWMRVGIVTVFSCLTSLFNLFGDDHNYYYYFKSLEIN